MEEVRADSDGHSSDRLLLTETMDIATTQNQFARHETSHISATVDETVDMTTKEGEGGGGDCLSENIEETIATAAASVEEEKVGTRTTVFVISMLMWDAARRVPTERWRAPGRPGWGAGACMRTERQ